MSSAGKTARTQKGGRSTKSGGRSLWRRILKGVLVTGLLGTATGIAVFLFVYASTDVPDPNRDFQTQTTYVYYAGGNREIGRFEEQRRESVPLGDVPQHVQDAVIAAEDRTFYSNKGIDPRGIVRAAFSNAQGNATQGASTITQQYVKVLYLSTEQSLTRKVKEAFVALKIQQQMSKREILQGYLNTIYFGRGAYGIEAAAQAFFDKSASELTVAEGAVLAAVLNSPGNLDPKAGEDNRQALQERYDYVIRSMVETGTLEASEAAELTGSLPRFPQIRIRNVNGGQRGFVLDLVRQELLAEGFSEQEIDGGGLRVRTSLTQPAMNAARDGMQAVRPDGFPASDLHVAVASVEPGSGALRGFYAGQGYLQSQLNWATTGSSPGSTFKAFAVAAALQNGFSLDDTFDGNSPLVLPDGTDVENQGNQSYGSAITLETATENSVNTAFIDLTLELGAQKVLNTATNMGIPQNAPGLEANTGIALGSATISPIDMANAYATIANRGQYTPVHVLEEVTDLDGRVLWEQFDESRRVLRQDVADDASYALQQVVAEGTGSTVQSIGRPAAGKTGTATDGNGNVSSSWFVGYTPQLSTAVMYARGDGNDPLDGYLPSFFGSVYPAQTWAAVMSRALEGTDVAEFPPPGDVDGDARTAPPTPTSTPEPTSAPSPTSSPTPSESPTPSPTPSESPTPSPTPTPTPTPSPTPSPTPTPSSSPSDEQGLLGRMFDEDG
ncbi:penicillin-binding protein [Nocardioidaceae bacterium]|nr:penicillin-binding protein [Nocardioidaceae bacterium]